MSRIRLILAVTGLALVLGVSALVPQVASAHNQGGYDDHKDNCYPKTYNLNQIQTDSVDNNHDKDHHDHDDCEKEVVPAEPTFTAPACDKSGSYAIPSTKGVDYLINGQVVAAGTYTAQTGSSVTITAKAQKGYEIEKGSTTTWSYTFTAATNCGQVLSSSTSTPPAATPQVTAKPTGGVSAGVGAAAKASPVTFIGFAGSIVSVAFGLVLRRKWTV